MTENGCLAPCCWRGAVRRAIQSVRGADPIRVGTSPYSWPIQEDSCMPPCTRLKAYDYASSGWYFVTTVTGGRRPLFGTLTETGVEQSRIGQVVADEWESTLRARAWISCAASVVMPDHFHALLGWSDAPANRNADLSGLMSSFKGYSTKRLRRRGLLRNWEVVWHRGYWDQVIRGPRHFDIVLRYIEENPARAWNRGAVRSAPRTARREQAPSDGLGIGER